MSDEGRMYAFESAVQDIRDAVVAIARLEERHQETREALSRAFTDIAQVRDRQDLHGVAINDIRGQMVPLAEARKWMMVGIMGVVSMVGLAVVALVIVQ